MLAGEPRRGVTPPDITVDVAAGRPMRAVWENEGHRVSAVLHFDQAGDLADFHSDDRYRIQGDTAVLERWSTPILSYQEVDGLRLPREAEARWGAGEDRWSYARFVLEAVVWD